MKILKKSWPMVLALLFCLSFSNLTFGVTQTTLAPPSVTTGCFVDQYKNNIKANATPQSNPTIALLSGFAQLWKPGSTWDTGTKLQSTILDANIQKSINITTQRSQDATLLIYLDDRRDQSYSTIDGLGPYTDDYRTKAGAVTTITDIASDATTKKYDDKGNGAGDEKSSLGSMVQLVNTLRGDYSSTTPTKLYYQYPRPYRWSEKVVLLPELVPCKSATPQTDGGFPSGHTNASYLAALAFAYSMPQRYQEMLTRASELGNDRILAGMHSTFDVMAGRMMGTALAAAILNDPQNKDLKLAAISQGSTLVSNPEFKDRFAGYAENKKNYNTRLTGGFLPVSATNKPMMVPKGAEVLLETRLPYLDQIQRRWVLYTTGLPSGYPLLDDPEGWGRLNLFAAADGYGMLLQDVTVMMDAAKGGFNARDHWRNDISGKGMLIKKGSGALELMGNNSYSGGTRVEEGNLEGYTSTAFGSGSLWVNGGTLVNQASDALIIKGKYTQSSTGALKLHLGKKNSLLNIKGAAKLDGKLILSFSGNDIPKDAVTLITCAGCHGKFSSIETEGLSSAYTVKVNYQSNQVQVTVISK
jgi:autotransporter-associated beta strand protein